MPYFKLGMDKKVIVPYVDYLNALKPNFAYVGDRGELKDLVRTLFLPSANSVKLIAARGVGSTSLLDGMVHLQQDDMMPDEFMVRPIFYLNSSNLFNTSNVNTIESRFHDALQDLRTYARQRQVKPILVIDNAFGFASNAPRHVLNALVEAAVAADTFDVIFNVEEKKEQDFNQKHPEFMTSFSTKKLGEPDKDQILIVLRHHARKHRPHGVLIDDAVLAHIFAITNRFKSLYDTAQPNRSVRLLDSVATAFRLDIHSRPPGLRDKQAERQALVHACAALDEGDEGTPARRDDLTARIGVLDAEIAALERRWDEHRAAIKAKQADIRTFDSMIVQMQQEIEALDAQTRRDNEKMARDQLGQLPEGHDYFKGKAKQDVLQMGHDDLLDFVEFDLFIHRSPRVRELQADMDTYTGRVAALNRELEALSKTMHVEAPLTIAWVDSVASAETNTPVGGLDGRLRANLTNGVALMKETVFGQDQVIEPIIKTLRRTAAGLNDPNRPLGVFMIAGPPGVGKTYIGEQLAARLFGADAFCKRIDMENFKESHTVSQLIGAPPGYAGYGKKGALIEAAQKMPFGVVVLDEIEKAHPEVRQALLKMIGSGQMKGLDGEEADFRNIVIVQTTNYAQDLWRDHPFDVAQTMLVERLRQDLTVFSPEYLDRHDAILCAGPLTADALTKIVGKQVRTLRAQARRRNPRIEIAIPAADLRRFVEDHCEGASGRHAKRRITEIVGDPLTDILLSGGQACGRLTGSYDMDDQRFTFVFDADAGTGTDEDALRDPVPA